MITEELKLYSYSDTLFRYFIRVRSDGTAVNLEIYFNRRNGNHIQTISCKNFETAMKRMHDFHKEHVPQETEEGEE